MTRRLERDGTAAVNRHAAADEIGVVSRSQRTALPAYVNFISGGVEIGVVSRSQRTALPAYVFRINNKPAAGRVGYARLAFVNERLAGAGGDRNNPHGIFVVDQQ